MLNIEKENLMELNALMQLLGYEDERSVKKWCKQNKIPVLKIGAKKYTLTHLFNKHIGNQLKGLGIEINNTTEDSSRPDKPEEQKEIVKLRVLPKKESPINEHSKASQHFLRNIKVA